MANIHEYQVTVNWKGSYEGSGSVSTKLGGTFPLSVPPEYKGKGEGTNPEELLTSAVCACYSITYGIIAANRKLEYTDLKVEAVGEVEQNGSMLKFLAITIKPTITLAAGADDAAAALAEDIAHKADAYCVITNAVKGNVAIKVEPTVNRG
jgi:peroxiredoxin-like protein